MSEQENFSIDIQEWDKLNNLIKQYEDNLKELRNEKKKIQNEKIIPFMKTQDYDICNLKDGKVHLKKSKKKVNYLTKKSFPDKLKAYYMDVENMDENISTMKVETITKHMDSACEYTETYTLSKIKSRKKDNNS